MALNQGKGYECHMVSEERESGETVRHFLKDYIGIQGQWLGFWIRELGIQRDESFLWCSVLQI
jgi:hypothetical protein